MKLLLLIVMLLSALYGISLTDAEPIDIVFMCAQLGMVLFVLIAMNKLIYSNDIILAANPLYLFIYIYLAHFYMDSFTYLSPQFIEIDPYHKLFGSVVIAASLFVMIYMYSRYQPQIGNPAQVAERFLNIPSQLGYVMFALQIVLIVFLKMRGISAINYNEELTLSTQEFGWDVFFPILMLSSTLQITSFLAGIMISKPLNVSGLLSRYAAVAIILSNIIVVIFIVRGRTALLSCVINFLITFQLNYKKLGGKILELFSWLFPMGIAYLGMVLLIAMGRQTQITYEHPLEAYANRLAFVSYATRVADATIDVGVRISIITDSIIYSTPQILLPNKYELNTHSYEIANSLANLPANIDWPDTLFSSGAQLGGWIGLFVFPVFISWVICISAKYIVGRCDTFGPVRIIMYFALFLSCNIVEYDPNTLVSLTRHNIMIALLLGIIVIPVYVLWRTVPSLGYYRNNKIDPRRFMYPK